MECEETGLFKHELAFLKRTDGLQRTESNRDGVEMGFRVAAKCDKSKSSFSIIGVRLLSARGCVGVSKTLPRDFQDLCKLCLMHSKAKRRKKLQQQKSN